MGRTKLIMEVANDNIVHCRALLQELNLPIPLPGYKGKQRAVTNDNTNEPW